MLAKFRAYVSPPPRRGSKCSMERAIFIAWRDPAGTAPRQRGRRLLAVEDGHGALVNVPAEIRVVQTFVVGDVEAIRQR